MTRTHTFVAALAATVVVNAAAAAAPPLPWAAAGHSTAARASTAPAPPWGAYGHRMAARAAAESLPTDVPDFFRVRAEQLVYLNPEPDRWRNDDRAAMNEAFRYDHYIDLERVPEGALDAEDRWEFLDRLYAAGVKDPASEVGLLPYRIVELQQRLETHWQRWRRTPASPERGWIEDAIIHDAGILGHYVTDASQPQHTTIHFNGWDEDTPNPEGYPRDRDFHARFESRFVDAHVRPEHLSRALEGRTPRRITDVRAATMDHILEAHHEVEELYRLDRDIRFDPERAHPRTVAFAAERLVSGAEMLQDLWWSAWLASAE